jgi:hypothetical protein
MSLLRAAGAFGLVALVSNASAACLNITHSYSGSIPSINEVVGYGPFTVDDKNGCTSANIVSEAKPLGAGAPPRFSIQRLVGAS